MAICESGFCVRVDPIDPVVVVLFSSRVVGLCLCHYQILSVCVNFKCQSGDIVCHC